MKATDFLEKARAEMKDREKTYDSASGERSMRATVAMFNAMTGFEITEEQGWKFMVCLKLVRSEQGDFRDDNFVDGVAYFGLAGETASSGGSMDDPEFQQALQNQLSKEQRQQFPPPLPEYERATQQFSAQRAAGFPE